MVDLFDEITSTYTPDSGDAEHGYIWNFIKFNDGSIFAVVKAPNDVYMLGYSGSGSGLIFTSDDTDPQATGWLLSDIAEIDLRAVLVQYNSYLNQFVSTSKIGAVETGRVYLYKGGKYILANYNEAVNIPIENADLYASDFIPSSGKYYRQIGNTFITTPFTQGQPSQVYYGKVPSLSEMVTLLENFTANTAPDITWIADGEVRGWAFLSTSDTLPTTQNDFIQLPLYLLYGQGRYILLTKSSAAVLWDSKDERFNDVNIVAGSWIGEQGNYNYPHTDLTIDLGQGQSPLYSFHESLWSKWFSSQPIKYISKGTICRFEDGEYYPLKYKESSPTPGGTSDYNDLSNTPIINGDLLDPAFTPVEGNYYRQTGTTKDVEYINTGWSVAVDWYPNVYATIEDIVEALEAMEDTVAPNADTWDSYGLKTWNAIETLGGTAVCVFHKVKAGSTASQTWGNTEDAWIMVTPDGLPLWVSTDVLVPSETDPNVYVTVYAGWNLSNQFIVGGKFVMDGSYMVYNYYWDTLMFYSSIYVIPLNTLCRYENSEYKRVLTETDAEIIADSISDIVDGTQTVGDSTKLNGQLASYYLDFNNLNNKPSAPVNPYIGINPLFRINQKNYLYCEEGTEVYKTVGGTTLNVGVLAEDAYGYANRSSQPTMATVYASYNASGYYRTEEFVTDGSTLFNLRYAASEVTNLVATTGGVTTTFVEGTDYEFIEPDSIELYTACDSFVVTYIVDDGVIIGPEICQASYSGAGNVPLLRNVSMKDFVDGWDVYRNGGSGYFEIWSLGLSSYLYPMLEIDASFTGGDGVSNPLIISQTLDRWTSIELTGKTITVSTDGYCQELKLFITYNSTTVSSEAGAKSLTVTLPSHTPVTSVKFGVMSASEYSIQSELRYIKLELGDNATELSCPDINAEFVECLSRRFYFNNYDAGATVCGSGYLKEIRSTLPSRSRYIADVYVPLPYCQYISGNTSSNYVFNYNTQYGKAKLRIGTEFVDVYDISCSLDRLGAHLEITSDVVFDSSITHSVGDPVAIYYTNPWQIYFDKVGA